MEDPVCGTSASTTDTEVSPLGHLLRQNTRASLSTPMPGQVLIGTLHDVSSAGMLGHALVPGLGRVTIAHSLVPLMSEHVGQGVALSLTGDDAAVVLGLLWGGGGNAASDEPPSTDAVSSLEDLMVTVDGRREVIEAARELELRCGEACILLTADGRIQLRGTYITSYASETQRIVGGSVHVN